MAMVDVSIRDDSDQIVVVLDGVLDVADAARVAAALAAVAVRGRAIIVDLAGLVFIDSSGVAALVHGRKQAQLAGGELELAAPQRQVLWYLTLTHLVDVFGVCASVDEAAGGISRPLRAAVPVRPRRSGSISWPWNALRQGRRAAERETAPASRPAGP